MEMPEIKTSTEAFATLVTNADYGLGASVLGYKLRLHGTTRTTVVMVTDSVPANTRDMLSKTWDVVLDVTMFDSNDRERLAVLKRPELGVTFSKLNVWRLVQYSKVVFVDADTMPLRNIDELFGFEELSACRDTGWPDCFNSGLFVLKPSLDTYNSLLRKAVDEGSFDGGDQGLLNSYFNTWSFGDISKHIPFTYNVNPNASYTYLPAYQHFAAQVKMVHFLGAVKPWHYQFVQGQVLGQNIPGHTQSFLEEWHNTSLLLRQSYFTPSYGPANVYQGSSAAADSKEPLIPSLSTSTIIPSDSLLTPTTESGPTPTSDTQGVMTPTTDIQGVMTHISSQITSQEQAKLAK